MFVLVLILNRNIIILRQIFMSNYRINFESYYYSEIKKILKYLINVTYNYTVTL